MWRHNRTQTRLSPGMKKIHHLHHSYLIFTCFYKRIELFLQVFTVITGVGCRILLQIWRVFGGIKGIVSLYLHSSRSCSCCINLSSCSSMFCFSFPVSDFPREAIICLCAWDVQIEFIKQSVTGPSFNSRTKYKHVNLSVYI